MRSSDLTQLLLQTQPEYQSKLKHVWLLSEVPHEIRAKLRLPELDEGIDLIAESYEGAFRAIQATAFPIASPVGPRSGWLRPNGSAKAEESRATTPTVVANSAAIDVISGSRREIRESAPRTRRGKG